MCGSAAGSRPRLLGADEGSQLTNSRETLIYNIFARVGNASGANIFCIFTQGAKAALYWCL